ncbi:MULTISPECIES: citrulline utilization hydrolase CtlX [unclassified Saccharicrinis]|uniref:citrulline utilization hydrolase CtlX n=1 Tax=unclassified Saccharicrinis TaxID=2646859 RepID=UPI003D33DF70
MNQSTSNILLVRPANFTFNQQTAISNAFQNTVDLSPEEIKARVIEEFDTFAERLINKGVNVMVVQDTHTPIKPDAVFPNNWGSFHADGTAILYPIATPNRQVEKRPEIIGQIKARFKIEKLIDLSNHEAECKFLEGTGSIVFDHMHKIAYACLSPRTDRDVFIELCDIINYKPVYFTATDKSGQEIYHTNVMMSVSKMFSVICLESIKDERERNLVIDSLEQTGHEIISITLEQVNYFAGNMISLLTQSGEEILVMSLSAFEVLTDQQKEAIGNYCEPFPMNTKTIETIGGGSARCMISEIFLPAK